MISENQFLIGHPFQSFPVTWVLTKYIKTLSKNFSLSISPNAIPRPFINSHYTLTFTNYGFHDWFAKHLSKAWFHMDHYRQPTFSSITHYSYYQEVYRYSSWSSCGLPIIPHTIEFNNSAQLLAHFLGNSLQSSPVTKLIRSSAYHLRTDGQTEKWTES